MFLSITTESILNSLWPKDGRPLQTYIEMHAYTDILQLKEYYKHVYILITGK
jgi:hypothetical protein